VSGWFVFTSPVIFRLARSKLLDHHDAVAALQSPDPAYQRIVIGIEHIHFRAVRDIDAAGIRIHGDVVEIFGAARRGRQGDRLDEVVVDGLRIRRRAGAEQEKRHPGRKTSGA
jgi:hypothetical protein